MGLSRICEFLSSESLPFVVALASPLVRHTFEGTLTADDSKRYLNNAFEVPDGVERLELKLEFAPLRVSGIGNMLTLSVYDPAGSRGAGHRGGAEHRVFITRYSATPGYVPGPLSAGLWLIEIDTHLIMPGPPCDYQLEVAAYGDSGNEAPSWPPTHPGIRLRRGPGWYRGDLHRHSDHSDGHWTVDDLVAWARANRLDFVTLTDHNTISGLARMDDLTADDLLTIGGSEMTTYWGHALALGVHRWVDWRVQPGKRSMRDIASEVTESGGVFVIAHPKSPGDPDCTGCDWRYADMMPGNARVVEVWNGSWTGDSNNERAVALWYSWLEQGLRIVASAGSDAHEATPPNVRLGYNVVYANELTEREILEAIATGHSYLSSGPRLELTAEMPNGLLAMSGDLLPREATKLRLRWQLANGDARLRLVVDGRFVEEQTAGSSGEWMLDVGRWSARSCLVELRTRSDELAAMTNPIFWDAS